MDERHDHIGAQNDPMPKRAKIIAGGSAAILPLLPSLLPMIVLGIKQLLDIYHSIINHPETPEALKTQYAELTGDLDATRVTVNETIRLVRGQ